MFYSYFAKLRALSRLRKVDSRKIRRTSPKLSAFAVVRNERQRLPQFLAYYRKLGVQRFFIVDNGSEDQTIDFLLSEPDTHVFYTKESYTASLYGSIWIEILVKAYALNQWAVIVDADERIRLPEKFDDFNALANALEAEKYQAALFGLLDMYSSTSLKSTRLVQGQEELNICPYFDPTGYETDPIEKVPTNAQPNYILRGGVRRRVFGIAPNLNKISFLKVSKTCKLLPGMHFVRGLRVSPMLGCVYHFKFFSDFIAQAQEESRREEHFNGAEEYKTYREVLVAKPDLSLFGPDSQQKVTDARLKAAGILKADLDKWVEGLSAHQPSLI